MNNKITIIEGPPPAFEPVSSDWAYSINECAEYFEPLVTNLRTMNGNSLIERCYNVWSKQETMFLHYRNRIGLERKVPIIAARLIDAEEGQKLMLWVRMRSLERRENILIDDDEPDDDE